MHISVLLFVLIFVVAIIIIVIISKALKRLLDQKDKSRNSKREENQEEEIQKKEQDIHDIVKDKQIVEKVHISPEKRGGAPRGPKTQSELGTQGRTLKPEIVCWKDGRKWIIGIEMPEDFEDKNITQNGEPLDKDNINENRYRLKSSESTVNVTWDGEEKKILFFSAGKDYFIFKMLKNWNEPGRLVRSYSTGYYLVIVPEEWKQNEEISYIAPVAPENVQLKGYKAHFFFIEKNSNKVIGFITANGERIQIESKDLHFQFIGKEIVDASEEQGPLFGEHPPKIEASNEHEWDNVRVIIIGEEGRGRNRWKTQFKPIYGVKKQTMPEKLTNRRGGWYFVRIYDKLDNLLESMDFRFMNDLKEIKVLNYSCIPDADGHKPVDLIFCHESNCRVQLMTGSLEINREKETTSVRIPNDSAYDITEWELKSEESKVIIEIMIERIWWNIAEEDDEYLKLIRKNFLDKPSDINRDFFNPTSKKIICIWLPKPNWSHEVLIGFNELKRRRFPVTISERFIKIPFRYFYDTDEIRELTKEIEIKLWIPLYNEFTDGITICKVLPEHITKEPDIDFIKAEKEVVEIIDPSQRPSCSNCDHARQQRDICRCRRYHWSRVKKWMFNKEYSWWNCDEWTGEYKDKDNNWIVK